MEQAVRDSVVSDRAAPPAQAPVRKQGLILAIGIFKLMKATALITLGVLAQVLTPEGLVRAVGRHLAWMGAYPGGHVVHHLISRIGSLDHRTAARLALLSFLYAGVFIVEGVGLCLRKAWAEWTTVGVTGSFVPLELYELCVRPSIGKVVALTLNVAIVAYLVWYRLREGREARAHRGG